MVYSSYVLGGTPAKNQRLARSQGSGYPAPKGPILGDVTDAGKNNYAQPKRPCHEPKRYPSETREAKEPRVTDTYWGLFDQFMERNAPKEYRK
jgi:hypothetical protein